jgi:hypothetical protein
VRAAGAAPISRMPRSMARPGSVTPASHPLPPPLSALTPAGRIVDYGRSSPLGASVRGIKRHEFVVFLVGPGVVDLVGAPAPPPLFHSAPPLQAPSCACLPWHVPRASAHTYCRLCMLFFTMLLLSLFCVVVLQSADVDFSALEQAVEATGVAKV